MKKYFSIKFGIFVFSLSTFLTLSQKVLAQGLIPCGGRTDPCTLCDLIILANNVFNFGLKILVIVTLLGIAIGGVMYILAAGNESAITRAKGFFWSSIVGFTIVLAAWLIVFIVMWFLSTKEDLGIGKADWNTFDCNARDSSSDQHQSGGGAGGGGGGSW